MRYRCTLSVMDMALLDRYETGFSDEVRAMAARRRLTGRDIATFLGRDEMWVSRRMTGRVAWTAGELLALTRLFGCALADLIPTIGPSDPDSPVRREGLEPPTRWFRRSRHQHTRLTLVDIPESIAS